MFKTLINKWNGGSLNSGREIKNRHRFRPGMENLEGRLSLSDLSGSTTTTNWGSPPPEIGPGPEQP